MREQQQMACDQLGDFNWNVSRSPAELSWSFRDTVAVTRSINCGPAFSCGAACLLKVSLFVDATLFLFPGSQIKGILLNQMIKVQESASSVGQSLVRISCPSRSLEMTLQGFGEHQVDRSRST
jgi:hypothetical protein